MSRRQHSIDASYESLQRDDDQVVPQALTAGTIDDGTQPTSTVPFTSAKLDGRVRWIHFMLGSAVLLPWNALITATPYFLSRLAGSPLQSTFTSYLSISFTVINFFVLGYATTTSTQSLIPRRIFVSTTSITILTILLTFSTWSTTSPLTFFSFVIVNSVLQGVSGSYLQNAVIATAALFGPAAMQAVMSGQAFVGVVVSGVQLLSAAASIRASNAAKALNLEFDDADAEARAARVFFGVSSLFMGVTLLAYSYLIRMPEYRAVVQPFAKVAAGHSNEEERRPLQSAEDADSDVVPMEKGGSQIFRIAKMNLVYEITTAYVFIITLAVFPPITATVQPVSPSIHPLIFTSVHFLVFNIGDLLGRYLCLVPQLLLWDPSKLLTLSLLRTFFIPLFLACNIQRPSLPSDSIDISSATTALIASDSLFFLILLAFGLSNGYVCSMTMMTVPSVAHNPALRARAVQYGPLVAERDVDVSAMVASFCLVGGLAVGSAMSFVVRGWVCACNPLKG